MRVRAVDALRRLHCTPPRVFSVRNVARKLALEVVDRITAPSLGDGLLIEPLFFKCLKTLRSACRPRPDMGDMFVRSRQGLADLPEQQHGFGTAHAEPPAPRSAVPA